MRRAKLPSSRTSQIANSPIIAKQVMRQNTNSGRRLRGRPNRNKPHGHQNRNSAIDSNGPEGKVRGNATQVYEKYLTLAREAFSAGNRVMAETFFQYAEQYYRVLTDSTDPRPEGAPVQQTNGSDRPDDDRGTRRNGGYEGSRRESPRDGVEARTGENPGRPANPPANPPAHPGANPGAPIAAAAEVERATEQVAVTQAVPAPAAEPAPAGEEGASRPRRGRPRRKPTDSAASGTASSEAPPRRARPRRAAPAAAESSPSPAKDEAADDDTPPDGTGA